MKLTFALHDWKSLAPGLHTRENWQQWADLPTVPDLSQPLAKPRHLPMMTARRLSAGSRAAVECGMALLARQTVDAIVFTSRHGELERNLRILQTLWQDQTPSPTDFAMSVHNSAVGSLTIAAAKPLVSSSVAAGQDSFQQGLIEVASLHQAGYSRVLLVDFDGSVPDYYQPWLPANAVNLPYAVALVITPGTQLQCQTQPRSENAEHGERWPQSLQFLRHWLAPSAHFTIAGERLDWHWALQHG